MLKISNMNLGDYINQLRREKGLTLRQLGKQSGVSFVTIQDIENGKTKSPGLDSILKLADGLGIHYTRLVLAFKGVDPDSEEIKGVPQHEIDEMVRDAVEFALRNRKAL